MKITLATIEKEKVREGGLQCSQGERRAARTCGVPVASEDGSLTIDSESQKEIH